jgi:hypothetical protein
MSKKFVYQAKDKLESFKSVAEYKAWKIANGGQSSPPKPKPKN